MNQLFCKVEHHVFVFYGMLCFLTTIHSLLCTSLKKKKNYVILLYLKVPTRHHSLWSRGLSSLSPLGGAKPGK